MVRGGGFWLDRPGAVSAVEWSYENIHAFDTVPNPFEGIGFRPLRRSTNKDPENTWKSELW